MGSRGALEKKSHLQAALCSFLLAVSAAHQSLHVTSPVVSDMGHEGKGSGLGVGTNGSPVDTAQD